MKIGITLYSDFKTFVLNAGLAIFYEQKEIGYDLIAHDGYIEHVCSITDTNDITDFETNYKSTSNKNYVQHIINNYQSNYQILFMTSTQSIAPDWTSLYSYEGHGYLESLYADFNNQNINFKLIFDTTSEIIPSVDLGIIPQVSMLPLTRDNVSSIVFNPKQIIRFNSKIEIFAQSQSGNKTFNSGYISILKG